MAVTSTSSVGGVGGTGGEVVVGASTAVAADGVVVVVAVVAVVPIINEPNTRESGFSEIFWNTRSIYLLYLCVCVKMSRSSISIYLIYGISKYKIYVCVAVCEYIL